MNNIRLEISNLTIGKLSSEYYGLYMVLGKKG